ncbi:hypothetical protein SO802_031965 [Lithocarpus litseifolius]|uniref:Uncharacterized protein n=1 Tax=Lithocarpus litseifolius TaxID=425828 RepID=A0AAW2BQ16_9ROSI
MLFQDLEVYIDFVEFWMPRVEIKEIENEVCSDINKPNDRMAVMTFISILTTHTEETGFSMGSHEACSYDGGDLLDRSHFPDLEDNNCAIGNNDGERQKFHEPLNDENGNKVNTPEPKSYQNASELKADSSSVPFAFRSLDEEDKRANLPDDDTVSSSNQGELLLWVNDYSVHYVGLNYHLVLLRKGKSTLIFILLRDCIKRNLAVTQEC